MNSLWQVAEELVVKALHPISISALKLYSNNCDYQVYNNTGHMCKHVSKHTHEEWDIQTDKSYKNSQTSTSLCL